MTMTASTSTAAATTTTTTKTRHGGRRTAEEVVGMLPLLLAPPPPRLLAASPAAPPAEITKQPQAHEQQQQQQQQQERLLLQRQDDDEHDSDSDDFRRDDAGGVGARPQHHQSEHRRQQQQPLHQRQKQPSPPRRHGSVRHDDPTKFYASLLAGAASGALASVLCAPLDLVRVRMQVWGQVVGGETTGGTTTTTPATASRGRVPVQQLLREIKQLEGYRGFFKGLGATLLTVPVFWAIYFPCYDELKSYWLNRYSDSNINPSLIHMMSAVQAGAVADVVCNPMFVVRTRLQTEALHDLAHRRQLVVEASSTSATSAQSRPPRTLSIAATVRNLYVEGGILGFWRGMTANLLGLAHVAIQFPLYEHLKSHLRGDKRHESAVDLLLASSASKMAASFVSYPHEVIRSRMMDARLSHPASFTDTCQIIYKHEGVRGFYAGLPVSVLRVIPNTCVTFVTYELFLRWTKQQLASSYKR